MTSGLAAAYTGGSSQDLGALGGASGWQISSLDGEDEKPTQIAAPTRPDAGPSQWAGADPFAPPPEEHPVELEVPVEVPPPAAPPVVFKPSGSAAATAPALPPDQIVPVELPPVAPPDGPLLERAIAAVSGGRAHFVAGVALALFLGFVPAHVVGCAREGAYDDIRETVAAEYAKIDSPTAWDSAADARAEAQSRLDARRRNVAVSSTVVWALAFAGLAYGWFHVLDWDRLTRRSERAPTRPHPRGGGRA
jgi:hypothetical protein